MVRAFEASHGIQLPGEYRDFLLAMNGGGQRGTSSVSKVFQGGVGSRPSVLRSQRLHRVVQSGLEPPRVRGAHSDEAPSPRDDRGRRQDLSGHWE
nr:SMI1/KNR4 family protein [Myxococcus sp. AB025B]